MLNTLLKNYSHIYFDEPILYTFKLKIYSRIMIYLLRSAVLILNGMRILITNDIGLFFRKIFLKYSYSDEHNIFIFLNFFFFVVFVIMVKKYLRMKMSLMILNYFLSRIRTKPVYIQSNRVRTSREKRFGQKLNRVFGGISRAFFFSNEISLLDRLIFVV